jgi:hypothetical protein
MKKTLRNRAIAAAGAVVALVLSSCAYDPYYSSVSGFSTSLFVSTGDSRWGYDPHCYSYYDYHRRCYYDPYLNGYYPIGYRPPVVYGVPHPYGYRHGYCPPPRYYSNVTVVNYRNREAAYRNTNYGWARQVRQQPSRQRIEDQHPVRGGSYYGRPDNASRPGNSSGSAYRTDQYTPRAQQGSYKQPGVNRYTQGVKPGVREQQGSRLPQSYNTPVTRNQSGKNHSGRQENSARNQPRQSQQQNYNRGGGGGQKRQEESKTKEGGRKVRSLGQG